ncbi:MAG: ElyC/SanA/YdcF family protein [Bacteroidota bacterium]
MRRIRSLLSRTWQPLLWAGPLAAVLVALVCHSFVERSAEGAIFEQVEAVPERPVALVLGTAKTVEGRPNRFYTARMQAAADLYHDGTVEHLLVSGDNSTKFYDEPTAMRDDLVALGVPAEAITEDYAGFRTLDSVVRAREVFGQDGFVVVSQRFHAERAVFLADAHGLDAVAYCAADVSTAAGAKTYLREVLARVKAVLDVYVLRTDPKFLGEPVEIALS